MDELSDVKDRNDRKWTKSLRRRSVEVSSNDKDGNSIQAYESGEAETGALR